MENTYWQKQADKPLFPDLLWSRPENKRSAGKLLIIGGNRHGFAAPASTYQAALDAGIGVARVLLPDSLKKIVGQGLTQAEFAPSTPSGSFSRPALASMCELAEWADGVLLAGDFGRNSETAIVLDSFAQKFKGILVAAGDSLDYFLVGNSRLLGRPETLAAINLGKLQKLAKNNNPEVLIHHSDSLLELVQKLSDWSQTSNTNFITKHEGQLIVANSGKVSTTKSKKEDWQVVLPAHAITWLTQQPGKTFESLTTAVYEYAKNSKPSGAV